MAKEKPLKGASPSLLTRALTLATERATVDEASSALLFACLADASACHDGLFGRREKIKADAWFRSSARRPWSFLWVMDMAHGDAAALRRVLD